MKNKLLLLAAACVAFILPSCVDGVYATNGYSHGYSTGGYISTLPYGYSTVYVGGNPYYYHRNYWYKRSHGRYIRTSRPHGYHGTLGRHSSHSNHKFHRSNHRNYSHSSRSVYHKSHKSHRPTYRSGSSGYNRHSAGHRSLQSHGYRGSSSRNHSSHRGRSSRKHR